MDSDRKGRPEATRSCIYQMEHGGEASVLDWVCRLTLFIAPALSFPGTYRAWRHRTLGVGGRRPEPTVAALMCNLAWVMYGIQVAEQKFEPVSLNAWGGLLQLVYLITFLALCTPEERDRVPVPMGYACIYLCFTFLIGGLHADAFKWFCTVAGWVTASAPLLSFAFLSDEWTIAVLPYWGTSGFSMLHGVLWLARGFAMENGPNQTGPNYSMVTQNGLGAFCSLILLLLALCWPYAHAQLTAQDAHVRASITRTEIVDAARAAQNQGVTLAPHQTRQTRRRRTGQQVPPPPQPAGQQVPPPQQPAGQQVPPPQQPAGEQVPPPQQPADQQGPELQQPATHLRRSPRLQALSQTSGGDQVPPATPSTSTSNVSHSHRYKTRQNTRATGQAVSIDIPEPIQRGPNHSGRF